MAYSRLVRLPNANRARVDRDKILKYLLCHEHPDGAPKARFFERFGFKRSAWEKLAAALFKHAMVNVVRKMVETDYGTRYTVDGPVETPDGRGPAIRTVWIVERESPVPRLVTAYPLEEPE